MTTGAAARVAIAWSVAAAAACGQYTSGGRSPSQLVVVSLLTAAGDRGVPSSFSSGPLLSDVPNVRAGEAVFDDFGQVTLGAILRDPGGEGLPTTPSPLNDVTVTQYRVRYRGIPGETVPRGFDGALTLTVPVGGTATAVFELVRHVAKMEQPLAALAADTAVVSVIADVTFFGHDQAGNALSVTGSVQINFANFR